MGEGRQAGVGAGRWEKKFASWGVDISIPWPFLFELNCAMLVLCRGSGTCPSRWTAVRQWAGGRAAFCQCPDRGLCEKPLLGEGELPLALHTLNYTAKSCWKNPQRREPL